jgi:hypothetical protein
MHNFSYLGKNRLAGNVEFIHLLTHSFLNSNLKLKNKVNPLYREILSLLL